MLRPYLLMSLSVDIYNSRLLVDGLRGWTLGRLLSIRAMNRGPEGICKQVHSDNLRYQSLGTGVRLNGRTHREAAYERRPAPPGLVT